MRVREPGWLKGIWRRPWRSRLVSSRRCSSVIAEVVTSTRVRPGTVAVASAVSRSMRSRMGQPSMVTRMCTRAMPSSSTSTESTIPSSGRGRWISGSITPFSASWMAATRSSPGFSAVVTAVPSCGGGGICSRLGGGGTRGVLRSESLALLRERGGDLLARQGAQGVDVGLRGGRLVELLEQVTQLAADEVARGDVIQRQAQRGDLAGDEVGGGVVALVGLAILLGLDAVAVV